MLERFISEGMAAEQPPAPYARVHAMGHATYTGPIVMLPRGIRVEHHAAVEDTTGVWGIVRQWKDVHALHSVEYFDGPEWDRECEQLAAEVVRRNEENRRRSAEPDGYAMFMKSTSQYGFTTPMGEVWGWWCSTARARENAWTHADGYPEDVEGSPQGKVEDHLVTAPSLHDQDDEQPIQPGHFIHDEGGEYPEGED